MKTKTVFASSSRQLAPWFKQNCRVGKTAGLLLIAALVFSNCGGETKADKEKAAAAPPPVPVVVTPVIQKTVPIFSEFTAQADARDTVELRARVEAFLERIHFEEGRPVKKGQLLFTLDKRKYEAEVQSAKAQVAKAQADLEFAREKVTVDTAKARLDSAKGSARESGSGRESSHTLG